MVKYHRRQTRTTVRRPYKIVVGLREGYGKDGKLHSRTEAEQAALRWMTARIAAGKPYLTGTMTQTSLVYAWGDRRNQDGRIEPAVAFEGVVSVTYLPDTPDTEVIAMLEELAGVLGSALGQAALNLEYRDHAWPLQVEGRPSPRGPHPK